MKAKKMMVSTLAVLSIATMGTATLPTGTTTAMAKTKAAKVIKTTKYKKRHKVHVRGGWMYSSAKLTHKRHHMTKYLYTKFYATKTVKVRKANGKKATLKYIKSKNGKVKGYVHSTYVWNQWGYGKYSVKSYRKNALKSLNRFRRERGLKPLKESAKLDKIAQKNSNRAIKAPRKFKANVKGVSHAGWVGSDYFATKSNPIVHYENGAQWGRGTINAYMGITDLAINYGAKPYLLSKHHTHIGLGGSQRGEAIYQFLLFSHK